MPEQQRAQAMQAMQIVPGDPRLKQVIRIDNDITDMDVDITIEEGIDVSEHSGRAVPGAHPARRHAAGPDPAGDPDRGEQPAEQGSMLQQLKEHQQAQAQQQQTSRRWRRTRRRPTSRRRRARRRPTSRWPTSASTRWCITSPTCIGMFNDMNAPPDPPSDPGTVVPPEVQATMDGANLRGMHAKAAVDEARANDLRHSAVQRINDVMIARHNALAPPEQTGTA